MNKNDSAHPHDRDVWDHQVLLLHQLIDEVQRCCVDKRFFESGAFGLPYSEIRALVLFKGERYLTVMAMAERLEVAKSRVTKLVNSMNDKGLVRRMPDPLDGRVRLLRLTNEGRRVVDRITAFEKTMQERILAKLEPGDRSRVISGLELLRSAMQTVKAEMEAASSTAGAKQTNEVENV